MSLESIEEPHMRGHRRAPIGVDEQRARIDAVRADGLVDEVAHD